MFINLSWMTAEKLLTQLFNMITGFLILRYLGPSDAGQLFFAFMTCSVLSVFLHLGLESLIINDLVRRKLNSLRVFWGVLLIRIVLFIPYGILSIIFLNFLNSEIDLLLGVILVLSFIHETVKTALLYFLFPERISRYAQLLLCVSIFIFLLRILIVEAETGIYGLALTYFVQSLSLAIVFLVAYRCRYGNSIYNTKLLYSRLTHVYIIGLLSRCRPLFVASFMSVLTLRIDQFIFNFYFDDELYGLYISALRIIEASYIVPLIITSWIYPYLLSSRVNVRLLVLRTNLLLFVIGSIVTFITLVWGAEIVSLLLGPSYLEAADALKWLAFAIPFVYLYSLNKKLLLSQEKNSTVLITSILSVLSISSSVLVGINLYGSIGAIWGYPLGWALSYLLALLIGLLHKQEENT